MMNARPNIRFKEAGQALRGVPKKKTPQKKLEALRRTELLLKARESPSKGLQLLEELTFARAHIESDLLELEPYVEETRFAAYSHLRPVERTELFAKHYSATYLLTSVQN